jgi:hypothetical protein
VAAVDAYRGLQARLASLPPPDATSSSSSRAAEWAALAGVLAKATSRVETARHAASDAALEALPDYHARQAVLKAIGYVDPELGTVTLKGRVACEINTAVREALYMLACCVVCLLRCYTAQDELVATEMLFAGVLAPLSACTILLILCYRR